MSKYDTVACQLDHTIWKIPDNTLTLHDVTHFIISKKLASVLN